ncbi:MAG TPA: hypothetical protein VG826_17910 [Pirellulales bacterium]|nr:hypothetical protein [Pirellulales bacterium]
MTRRFQFSLKAMLLLVVVVAIYSFLALTIRERHSLFPTPAERRDIRRELDRLADEAQAANARASGEISAGLEQSRR